MAIFILNALIQLLDTPNQFPEPIEFIEWPLLFGGIITGAIWVGVGRPHLFFKISAYLLALTLLFYLSAIEWLDRPWPWDQFYWIGVLANSSTLVLIAGFLLLLGVSIPLLVWRLFSHSDHSRLSIIQLLAATTCFALTLAIAVTWSSWRVLHSRLWPQIWANDVPVFEQLLIRSAR